MSTFNGRHGPNVSQYLRDLNTINPQDAVREETFTMEDDLALFTNTQFFDFDSGQNLDFQAQPVKADTKSVARHNSSTADDVMTASPSVMGDISNLDFMSGDFSFSDFSGGAFAAPSLNSFADGAQAFQPLQPIQQQQQQQQSQFRQGSGQPGDKQKSDSAAGISPIPMASQQLNFEDASRAAAEDDKRRRNTAASARFRIKKKQREQALEKSAKEMTDKITSLENKVSQLETENKWLKNLLVEKNEGGDDITALWREFTKHASTKTKAAPASSSAAEFIKTEG
ncbi:hypothetical protein RJ55_00668 [Drechmeria coniospora]|nr:hypothetical protein RJ55_00668 [Drechmeria coniospora]